MQFSEKQMEEKIIEDISLIGINLIVINNQVDLGGYGVIDILAFNCESNKYAVLELKSEIATSKSLTQLMRYMQGVKDFLGIENVEGYLLAPSIEDDVVSAIRLVQEDIKFIELEISITGETANYTRAKDNEKYISAKNSFEAMIKGFREEYKDVIERKETPLEF